MIYIQTLCFVFTGTRSFADEVTQLSNNNSATSLIIEDVSVFIYVFKAVLITVTGQIFSHMFVIAEIF